MDPDAPVAAAIIPDAMRTRVGLAAAERHGVLTTTSIRGLGASASWIKHQRRTGYLFTMHRGVVAVGHLGLSPRGRWSGAVQAAGDGAALAGFAAAALWGITRRSRYPIRVLTPRPRRPVPGIQVREAAWIVDHVTTEDGIDVLTPAATIVSVAAECSVGELVYMIREAQYRGYDVIDALLALGRDGTRRPGSPRLRDAIYAYLGGDRGSDSRLEDEVYALVSDVLPARPIRNLLVRFPWGDGRLDIAWGGILAYVEVHGTASHDRPDQRRIDRRRRRWLDGEGWLGLEVSEREFRADPFGCALKLRAALRARATEVQAATDPANDQGDMRPNRWPNQAGG